ncbi:hypothetical protein HK104_006856 [Borealophlyctis nickersoniae]|nr:hypothetical protein HK104_006856 [Borealophlyctis nickersoniae]
MIAIDMKLFLFTANEYVVHRNDLGLEMYFITQGRIDIYASQDLKKPTASLIEGAHFGEFGIILGHRHEYSARAVCNTDIYVLTRGEIQHCFDAYPEDKIKVVAATEKRYKQQLAAKKSRGKAHTDDLEEDYGVGAINPDTHPVTLAGGASRGALNVPASSTANGEGGGTTGFGRIRRMSLATSGYAILDKNMAITKSQNELAMASQGIRKSLGGGSLGLPGTGSSKHSLRKTGDRKRSSAGGAEDDTRSSKGSMGSMTNNNKQRDASDVPPVPPVPQNARRMSRAAGADDGDVRIHMGETVATSGDLVGDRVETDGHATGDEGESPV